MSNAIDRRKIEERAYRIFKERGGTHGSDLDDWLRAEREVLAQAKSNNRLDGRNLFPTKGRIRKALGQ